ncbi:MAG: hypothetical protein AAB566_00410 [Patescibacteria group bacterium]
MAKKKRRTIKKIKRRLANPPKFYRAKLGRAKRKLSRPEKRRPAKAVRKKTSRRPTKKTVKTRPTPRYVLDNSFEFLYELRDLVLKASPAEKDQMARRISGLGRVKLAIISGIFMNKEHADPTIADLLIVGDDIEQRRLRSFLRSLEAEVGKEIKFAVMEKDEFQYRLSMFDRFIRVLLESPHEKIINKLGL